MILQNNTLVTKDKLVTYKITPDVRVNNSKNEIITSTFAHLFKPPMTRFSIKDMSYALPNRVYFTIVLENKDKQDKDNSKDKPIRKKSKKQNVGFYLSFPQEFHDLVMGKVSTCWKNVGLDKVDDNSFLIAPIKDTVAGEMVLKDYNFKSISTSTSNSSHLDSLFQLMRSMNEQDKVIINMAIEPIPREDWMYIVKGETEKEENGVPKFSAESMKDFILKKGLDGLVQLLDIYLEFKLIPLNIVLGLIDQSPDSVSIEPSKRTPTKGRKGKQNKEIPRSRDNFEDRSYKSPSNRSSGGSSMKKNSEVCKCKITILSASSSKTRAYTNLLSVSETFKELNDDNEFIMKEISERFLRKRVIDIRRFNVAPDNNCILSSKEIATLLQLPKGEIQKEYHTEAITDMEGDISRELLQGKFPVAISSKRGKEFVVYRSQDKSVRCYPMIMCGSANMGKTTFLMRVAYQHFLVGDSNLVIDTIQDCKVAQACKEHIPDNMRVDIDVMESNEDNIPSFSFNEISNKITEDMKPFKRLRLASKISTQVISLISNISSDTALSDAMIRYLHSACVITFIKPLATIQDAVDVLRIPEKRDVAIEYAKTTHCFDGDDSYFYNLEQLDKYEKAKRKVTNENGEEVEEAYLRRVNNDTAIVGINNRMTQLESDPYFKKMLAQRPNPNEDFLKFIDEGKTINISIPQNIEGFEQQSLRDVVALYYFSRIWLAVQSRVDNDNARPCHVLLDELYTIPGTITLIKNHVTEFRRHRLGLVTSCHNFRQFGEGFEQIESANANFFLFSSVEKKSFDLLKERLQPYTYDDITALKPHHALILQGSATDKTSVYTGRLPNFMEDLSYITNPQPKQHPRPPKPTSARTPSDTKPRDKQPTPTTPKPPRRKLSKTKKD